MCVCVNCSVNLRLSCDLLPVTLKVALSSRKPEAVYAYDFFALQLEWPVVCFLLYPDVLRSLLYPQDRSSVLLCEMFLSLSLCPRMKLGEKKGKRNFCCLAWLLFFHCPSAIDLTWVTREFYSSWNLLPLLSFDLTVSDELNNQSYFTDGRVGISR